MNGKIAFEYLSGRKKFDNVKAAELSLRAACEGIVMLENKASALPLESGEKIAFFGRMRKHYHILGTGSGGRVNPPYKTNIFDSLCELGFTPDAEVEAFYGQYELDNPFDNGNGWSQPNSQTEPKLPEELVISAAARNDTALFVIARTAGEDCDLKPDKGGYYLTDDELDALKLLKSRFHKLCVLVNSCGIIDFSWVESVSPDALLLLWQGGMEGGRAAARVICGLENPSGKLPDTCAASRNAYPASQNIGKAKRVFYEEDIFVGYRYFETFAPEQVIYPFGFGLSYTEFGICFIDAEHKNGKTALRAVVQNLGCVAGKETVQCYISKPQNELGEPKRILCAFKKTPLLQKGESCTVNLEIADSDFASYDDKNDRLMLCGGEYVISLGGSVRDAVDCFSFALDETVLDGRGSTMKPQIPFNRLVNRHGIAAYEDAPLRKPDLCEPVPDEIKQTGHIGITLSDVADGKKTLREFIAQLTDNELCCIVRAEGMSSPKVTPGTAAAFGGVTESLRSLGIPAMCCTDGPSGVRMVSDASCIAYPAATCLAAGRNTELVAEAYELCGAELASYGVDLLLGPGVNIHRDPLCGRNFEYFSEDPLLAGEIAAAVCNGLARAGVSGVIKHFMANNQEFDRHMVDAVISERAIREIYARVFEIALRKGDIASVMTSYNPVNGRWAASNYGLTVSLLRDRLGFDGFVMTDWWAKLSGKDGQPCVTALSEMVHARNDIYMVTPDAETREDDLEQMLAEGSLTRGELQICALKLCEFAAKSLSFEAVKSGYGMRDLTLVIKDKTPFATAEIHEGTAVIASDKAKKAVLAAVVESATPIATQTNLRLNINTKKACGYIIGGTGGKSVTELREVSLVAGENTFVFTSESPLLTVTEIKLYE